jgi:hypothetical protein
MKPDRHDHLHPVDAGAARDARSRRLTTLRRARHGGHPVQVTYFTGHGNKVTHARGHVGEVAASDAFVVVGGLHIPCDLIVKVRILNHNQRQTGA